MVAFTGDDRVAEPALGNLYGIVVIRVRQGIEVAGDDGFAGMEFRVPCEVGIAQRACSESSSAASFIVVLSPVFRFRQERCCRIF